MVLKRKKNCKLIYEQKNSKYYVERIGSISEFYELQEAFREYGRLNNIEKLNQERFYNNDMLHYELYPEQVFLIAKSIEIFKFFIDNSFFFNCEKEELESKSVDLFYLYQILFVQYSNYVPKNLQIKIEKKYDFRNFRKYG